MKKLLLSLALVAGLGIAAQAQSHDAALDGTKLSIGGDFAFPSGNYANFMEYGAGASLGLQVLINTKAKIVGELGYLNFTTKKVLGYSFNQSYIPLKAGLRYFLLENLYAQGQIGAALATKNGGKTAFLYAPTIGAEFPVADKMTLDVGARYENWSNSGSISFAGIRAALNFGL